MRLWSITHVDILAKGNELLDKIQQAKTENKNMIDEILPFKANSYIVQGAFLLNEIIVGVIPEDSSAVVPKGWRKRQNYLVPNCRYKEGKMADKVFAQQIKVYEHEAYDLLNLSIDGIYGRYTMSGIYRSKDKAEVYLRLDDRFDLSKCASVTEVTISYVESKIND